MNADLIFFLMCIGIGLFGIACRFIIERYL